MAVSSEVKEHPTAERARQELTLEALTETSRILHAIGKTAEKVGSE
jgi:hypothetical protein